MVKLVLLYIVVFIVTEPIDDVGEELVCDGLDVKNPNKQQK